MSIAGVVFRRCLRHLALATPVLVALVLAATLADPALTAVSVHVACFALAAVACAVAVDSWPPFARNRGSVLLRLHTGPLCGCGAAALAALAALALALAALGTTLGWVGTVVPVPRAHVDANLVEPPPLLLPGTGATFRWTRPLQAHELHLRPLAILPHDASPQPVTLAVQLQGRDPVLVRIAGSGEFVRIPLDGMQLAELRIEHREGNLPLVFPAGSMTAASAATQPRPANGAFAALAQLPAAAIAMACATALGSVLAPAVALALTLAVLLVLTLGDITPAGDAVVAMLRGRWLPVEGIWTGLGQALLTALALAVPAAVLRRRHAG